VVYGGKNVMVILSLLAFHSLMCENMVHRMKVKLARHLPRLYIAHLTTYTSAGDYEINFDDEIS
jgi:hypothetical protein